MKLEFSNYFSNINKLSQKMGPENTCTRFMGVALGKEIESSICTRDMSFGNQC